MGLLIINREPAGGSAGGPDSDAFSQVAGYRGRIRLESVSRVFSATPWVAIAVTLLMLPLLDLATPTANQTVSSALVSQCGPLAFFSAGFRPQLPVAAAIHRHLQARSRTTSVC